MRSLHGTRGRAHRWMFSQLFRDPHPEFGVDATDRDPLTPSPALGGGEPIPANVAASDKVRRSIMIICSAQIAVSFGKSSCKAVAFTNALGHAAARWKLRIQGS